MATKKQRSKRAKTFRHDYALVVNDEEGNEVEVSSAELRGKKPEGGKSTTTEASSSSGSGSRRGTAPPPPSWERALKRGGLMGAGLAILRSAHRRFFQQEALEEVEHDARHAGDVPPGAPDGFDDVAAVVWR